MEPSVDLMTSGDASEEVVKNDIKSKETVDELSELERTKILLEEKFRAEVRRNLESERLPSSSKTFTFLNSALGLWVLSAIFVTCGGGIWNHWQTERDKDAAQRLVAKEHETTEQAEIEKLDLEISYRFSQTIIHLASLTDGSPSQATPPEKVSAVVEALQDFGRTPEIGLYAEYSKFTTLALIAEERRHLSQELRRDLDPRLGKLAGMVLERSPRDARTLAAALLEQMLPRWKEGWWFYTDCSPQNPFC
jgi:hypothetical protein